MSDMIQGLQVSGLGIFITFLALGVFILIMVVLQKLFPARREEPGPAQAARGPETEQEPAAPEGAEDPELVAAIVAAVTALRARRHAGLGASLTEGRSAWWEARSQAARQGGIQQRREG